MTYTVRHDSAGIEIIENNPVSVNAQAPWTVDLRPTVDIGTTSGPDHYMLASVNGAFRGSDARIFVGEFRVRLLFYDSTGQHDTTIVRLGQGPGEAELLSDLLLYRGDSLLLLGQTVSSTARGRRETVLLFDSRGRHGRSTVVTTPAGIEPPGTWGSTSANSGIQAVASDGSFIVQGGALAQLQKREGQRWGFAPFFRVSADGLKVDTIALVPISDIEESPNDPIGVKLPFFRREGVNVAVHDKFMYWGNGDRFEISVFDITRTGANSAPVRVIRHNLANRPVTAADRRRVEALSLRGNSVRTAADTARIRTRNATHPVRATIPAFEQIVVDQTGNVWAKHYRLTTRYRLPDDPSEPNSWTVFDASGALIGDVTLPANLKVTQIGSDWILGIWTDADDVQHIRLHRIVKRR
jgi:hypothetical protein